MVSRNRLSRRRLVSGIFRSKRLINLRQPMVLECKLKHSGKGLFDGIAARQLFGPVTWLYSSNPKVSLKIPERVLAELRDRRRERRASQLFQVGSDDA